MAAVLEIGVTLNSVAIDFHDICSIFVISNKNQGSNVC